MAIGRSFLGLVTGPGDVGSWRGNSAAMPVVFGRLDLGLGDRPKRIYLLLFFDLIEMLAGSRSKNKTG